MLVLNLLINKNQGSEHTCSKIMITWTFSLERGGEVASITTAVNLKSELQHCVLKQT